MKILVTGLIPKNGIKSLFDNFDVTYHEGVSIKRDEVLSILHQYDGVLLMAQKANKEFIDAGKNLKIISVNGVGYDNVDIAYAKINNIVVSNSPNAVMEPTAELTMTLMLSVARRVCEYTNNLRNGIWQNISIPKEMGFTLYGATLGIVGMGRIAKCVAKRANAFGMKILYTDLMPMAKEDEKEYDATYVTFDDLLANSDVVTIHTPLMESTYHMFNKETFVKMKNGSFIVNAARGQIIDESSLVESLKNGKLAGAGLDVFEFEPKISDELLKLNNVVMTPHAGTGCLSSRIILAKEASENLISFLLNDKALNVVN